MNVGDGKLTYQDAVDLVRRKIAGEPVSEDELETALRAYPQIGKRLMLLLEPNPPIPEWAKEGLRQMAEAKKRSLGTVD